MEREPRLSGPKLAEAAFMDYPAASEIIVSFPDQWELIQHMSRGDTSSGQVAGWQELHNLSPTQVVERISQAMIGRSRQT